MLTMQFPQSDGGVSAPAFFKCLREWGQPESRSIRLKTNPGIEVSTDEWQTDRDGG
jgi:hypothetical protein